MKTVLTLIVIIGGFFIGLSAGNKFMIWKYKIPTRIEADNQGKAHVWDSVLLFSIVIAIGIGIVTVNAISDGTTSIMATAAVLSWCFAVYWLVMGIHGFRTVRIYSPGGIDRYREPFPLFLAFSICVDLVFLGLFIVASQRELTFLTLFIFAALWLQWTSDATQRKKERKAEEKRRSEEVKRAS
jgi:hypothetical protein